MCYGIYENLKKFQAMDCVSRYIPEEGIVDIKTPPALLQTIGYLKKVHEGSNAVYCRGQCNKHPGMRPSLCRGVGYSKFVEFSKSLESFISLNQNMFEKNTREHTKRPLLQHYGYKTEWIDVVDNIWSALWFSCFKAYVSSGHPEYLHYGPNDREYGFIYIFNFGSCRDVGGKPGLRECKKHGYEVIDLRQAVSSTYLRPHAQHGLLARRVVKSQEDMDYSGAVVGVLRIKVSDGLKWLGDGLLSSPYSLFPSPVFDSGYRVLLESRFDLKYNSSENTSEKKERSSIKKNGWSEVFGGIQHIGTSQY